MVEEIEKISKTKDIEKLIEEFLFGKTSIHILNKAKKIYPIKRMEIVKLSLIEGK